MVLCGLRAHETEGGGKTDDTSVSRRTSRMPFPCPFVSLPCVVWRIAEAAGGEGRGRPWDRCRGHRWSENTDTCVFNFLFAILVAEPTGINDRKRLIVFTLTKDLWCVWTHLYLSMCLFLSIFFSFLYDFLFLISRRASSLHVTWREGEWGSDREPSNSVWRIYKGKE